MSTRSSNPTAPRGSVKGVVLQSRLALLRARGGDALVRGVLARLEPDVRQVLTGIVLPVAWYSFDINVQLDRAIALELGGGEMTYRQLGAQSAIDSLGAAHRNLVRTNDPHGLLKHAAQIHNLYYDTGYRTYEWVEAGKAILRTFDCASYSREDCQTNLGWHEKAIELCGGTSVRVREPRCRARGDACCEYVCEWEPPRGD